MEAKHHNHPHKHDEDCRHLLESLSDYVDGDLEAALCDEIERHLDDCEDCKIVIDTLEKTVYLYHQTAITPPVSMPEDVKERLFKRLDLEDFLNPEA